MSDKYQDQPWYVKLWRLRYYLLIPFVAVRIYFAHKLRDDDEFPLWFRHAWGIAVGLAQVKMNWVYEWEGDLGVGFGADFVHLENLFEAMESSVAASGLPEPPPPAGFDKEMKLLYPPDFAVGTQIVAEDGLVVGKVLSTEDTARGVVATCEVCDTEQAYKAVAKHWKK